MYDVSVIIPTLNRRELLREVIQSLWAQTLAPDRFEVIVVDNCSTDGTEDIMRDAIADSPCRLRYHRMPRNLGAVRSRNTGARMAEAPLLAFTDSDCRVTAKWLETALKNFANDPEVAFLTGPVHNKPNQPVKFFTVGSVETAGENPVYPTCNIVYRADVFWSVGGFDEGVYLGDVLGLSVESADIDLAWRLKDAGLKNNFVEELVVQHEVRQVSPMEWLLAHYCRVALIPEMLRRHPRLKPAFLWWGPFCVADNFFFYIAVLGALLAALLNSWFVVAVIPFVGRMARVVKPSPSPLGIAKLVTQIFFLTTRQALLCGSLVYGSIRARRLV